MTGKSRRQFTVIKRIATAISLKRGVFTTQRVTTTEPTEAYLIASTAAINYITDHNIL